MRSYYWKSGKYTQITRNILGQFKTMMFTCTIQLRQPSLSPTSESTGGNVTPGATCRTQYVNFKNPQVRASVLKKFKTGRKEARVAVDALQSELLCSQVMEQHEGREALGRETGQVQKYINESLTKSGAGPKTVRPVSSKPFWDDKLTLIEKERGRLWKAAAGYPHGSN